MSVINVLLYFVGRQVLSGHFTAQVIVCRRCHVSANRV